jgi:DNA-directed RNA polymerase specialized sigma24 family protein
MRAVDLLEAKKRMSDSQKAVFEQFYIDGRSSAEVCREQGWTPEQFRTANIGFLRSLRKPANEDVDAVANI